MSPRRLSTLYGATRAKREYGPPVHSFPQRARDCIRLARLLPQAVRKLRVELDGRPDEHFPAMPGRSGRYPSTARLPSRGFGHGRERRRWRRSLTFVRGRGCWRGTAVNPLPGAAEAAPGLVGPSAFFQEGTAAAVLFFVSAGHWDRSGEGKRRALLVCRRKAGRVRGNSQPAPAG